MDVGDCSGLVGLGVAGLRGGVGGSGIRRLRFWVVSVVGFGHPVRVPRAQSPCVCRAEVFMLRVNPHRLNRHSRKNILKPKRPKSETGAQGRLEYVQCWQIDTAKARSHASQMMFTTYRV